MAVRIARKSWVKFTGIRDYFMGTYWWYFWLTTFNVRLWLKLTAFWWDWGGYAPSKACALILQGRVTWDNPNVHLIREVWNVCSGTCAHVIPFDIHPGIHGLELLVRGGSEGFGPKKAIRLTRGDCGGWMPSKFWSGWRWVSVCVKGTVSNPQSCTTKYLYHQCETVRLT